MMNPILESFYGFGNWYVYAILPNEFCSPISIICVLDFLETSKHLIRPTNTVIETNLDYKTSSMLSMQECNSGILSYGFVYFNEQLVRPAEGFNNLEPASSKSRTCTFRLTEYANLRSQQIESRNRNKWDIGTRVNLDQDLSSEKLSIV